MIPMDAGADMVSITLVYMALMSMATAGLSISLTRSHFAIGLRKVLPQWAWLQNLFACPWCMSFWISIILVAGQRPQDLHTLILWVFANMMAAGLFSASYGALVAKQGLRR